MAKSTWLFLLAVMVGGYACGQTSLFDHLLATGDTIVLTLGTDRKMLYDDVREKEYQELDLGVDAAGQHFDLHGKVRTRGNHRLVVCTNPNLKIKLDKDDLLAAGFSELNEFKLVEQCYSNYLGAEYLRREQLVYKLHALYSPHSHLTIPVVIKVEGEDDINGFLVEEEEHLASRYGKVLELEKASTRGMFRPAYVDLCLFNYLVLNTDWEVFNLHNVELVLDTLSGKLLPIPYDFDYSGFVSTNYATPNEQLDLESIHIPYWQGRTITQEELKAGAKRFLAKRMEARQLIMNYPGLRRGDRRRLLKRLAAFNQLLDNEKRMLRTFR